MSSSCECCASKRLSNCQNRFQRIDSLRCYQDNQHNKTSYIRRFIQHTRSMAFQFSSEERRNLSPLLIHSRGTNCPSYVECIPIRLGRALTNYLYTISAPSHDRTMSGNSGNEYDPSMRHCVIASRPLGVSRVESASKRLRWVIPA